MTPSPGRSRELSKTIGELIECGDGACTRGDFAGLQQVALQLEDFMPEPLHCRLDAVAAACLAEPNHAVMLWDRVKTALYRESTRPSGDLARRPAGTRDATRRRGS